MLRHINKTAETTPHQDQSAHSGNLYIVILNLYSEDPEGFEPIETAGVRVPKRVLGVLEALSFPYM